MGSPNMPTELRYIVTPTAFQAIATRATIRNQFGIADECAVAMLTPDCSQDRAPFGTETQSAAMRRLEIS
jgi:hypothetical protein